MSTYEAHITQFPEQGEYRIDFKYRDVPGMPLKDLTHWLIEGRDPEALVRRLGNKLVKHHGVDAVMVRALVHAGRSTDSPVVREFSMSATCATAGCPWPTSGEVAKGGEGA